jgi:CRP-like cAMP-binding protein
MNDEFLLSFLGKIKIFQTLTQEEKLALIKLCQIKRYQKGDVIFKEGSPADSVYFIENGMAKVATALEQGDEKVLATLANGSVFGEMALVDEHGRSATVSAMANSTIYRLEKIKFDELRKKGHPIANKIIREISQIIAQRLRTANKKISRLYDDPSASIKEMEARIQEIRKREN